MKLKDPQVFQKTLIAGALGLAAFFAIKDPQLRYDFMLFVAPIIAQALPEAEESDDDDDDDDKSKS